MQKTFKARLAVLEALEQAQRELPPFVCIRADDWARLDDPLLTEADRDAIWVRYGLTERDAGQISKVYIGVCVCSWDGDGRACPVCEIR